MPIRLKVDVLKRFPRNLMNFLPWLELYDELVNERKYIKWLEAKYELHTGEEKSRRALIIGELINDRT